jgi:antitoxin (DNA-binding transcriptional repressor) of toxin-antitoxin stability system
MSQPVRRDLAAPETSLDAVVADAEAGTVVELVRRGVTVARVVPVQRWFGMGRGSIEVHGDIVAPTGEAWPTEQP